MSITTEVIYEIEFATNIYHIIRILFRFFYVFTTLARLISIIKTIPTSFIRIDLYMLTVFVPTIRANHFYPPYIFQRG